MPRAIALYMGQEKAPGACEIYRINKPFYYLDGNRGWRCGWAHFSHLVEESMRSHPSVYWERNFRDAYDVFVFPRFYVPNTPARDQVLNVIALLRDYGKLVIYEVDDDYTNEYRQVVDGDAITPASLCDAITVTTPMLAERMTRLTGRPAYVLPNMCDPALWHRPSKINRLHPNKITIGLSGSATHHGDWRVLETVMPRILREYSGKVHFLLTGYHPEYLHHLPNTDYLPGMDYRSYAELVKSCDIVLAPVDPLDGFNNSKSEIKTTEGQSAMRLIAGFNAGAAVIATDNPVYRLGVQHEKTGLLVEHTPDAWYDALKRVIENKRFREDLQINGHKWAKRHRNMQTGWPQWATLYSNLLREKLSLVKVV